MKLKTRLKALLCAAAFLTAAGSACIFADESSVDEEISNKSIAELETLKTKNNLRLEELQRGIEKYRNQFESTSATEKSKREYREKLQEKISIQNENLQYVVVQLNQLETEMQNTTEYIEQIQGEIAENKSVSDETFRLYKQRLRAAYMSGSDNVSAILTGSSSFFDVLTKAEITSRLAKRDSEMLKSLENKLENLSVLDDQLQMKQQVLNENLEDAESRKAELDEKLEILKSDFTEIQEELDKLTTDKVNFKKNYDAQKAALEEQRKEQDKITKAIKEEQERISIEMEMIEEQARKNGTIPVSPSGGQINVPAGSSNMLWPVPGYTSHSSFYGYREFDNSNHKAIDIQGNPGDTIEFAKIYAAESGKVITAQNYCTHYQGKEYSCGCGGGYGNYIVLPHSDGVYQTVYAHCYTIYVSEGDTVRKGQLIGLVGSTGYSTGPHLHFEVRKNGEKTNPDSYNYINYG